MVDPEKNPWPIVTSSIQIQLGTMQSLTLPYLPPSLSLHLGKQNGSQDLTPTPARFSCVSIIYHMPPPFVYEGPAVAVLYYTTVIIYTIQLTSPIHLSHSFLLCVLVTLFV